MFDPWLGSKDPTCLTAKKPKHRPETILLTNSVKTLKMVRTHTKKIFKEEEEIIRTGYRTMD